MSFDYRKSVASAFIVLAVLVSLVGCGQTQSDQAKPGAASPEKTTETKHGGWWCTEHGVSEEECAQCSSALAADFKAKGDWCKEHNRPESQCFICHPELAEKFAARYEAKFGEQPPKPTE